ncbi:hypothetical protein [Collimonas antrihumi]|uniref:hypothetical protein n=1 Tax=Collimonas antrihumi TaxID=1940615 RepID=UPI001B8D1D05|nr:hypothetical protein [Collimonas antrihumi]
MEHGDIAYKGKEIKVQFLHRIPHGGIAWSVTIEGVLRHKHQEIAANSEDLAYAEALQFAKEFIDQSEKNRSAL